MAFQHVGQPIKRVEDPKLITGADHYVNDVRLANALTRTRSSRTSTRALPELSPASSASSRGQT